MSANRLSQIQTAWTVLRQAHDGSPQATAAVQLLVLRYRGAVHRYLSRLLGDADAAEDLTQEFSLALLEGRLRGADPARGRFRNYVKSTLFHMVSKYRERTKRLPGTQDPQSQQWRDLAGDEEDAPTAVLGAFQEAWRDELLARAMEALRQANATYHAVLTLRAEAPEAESDQLAAALAERTGKVMAAEAVRQTLRRARLKFADLLFDEVAYSLDAPEAGQVEEELGDLGLLEYCKPLLDGE